jgi:2-polyprenyl-3-methyl-5-hydroxy-6-metoxy-1,4-benzoquinol methylase
MPKKFTDLFPDDLTYDEVSRTKKAKKIIAVLKDHLGSVNELSCLDLGCSIGHITEILGSQFKRVVGVDVDDNAIKIAKKNIKKPNVTFVLSQEKHINFSNESFDVVVFNQIYEHVENPKAMLQEIKRVLKKGGVCFFGARNKYGVFDGHYQLPFVSWLPRKLANIYIKMFTKKKYYDIKLLSLQNLRSLTKDFLVKDYTLGIIRRPKYFRALDSIPKTLNVNLLLYFVGKATYSFIPNYIWILTKKNK